MSELYELAKAKEEFYSVSEFDSKTKKEDMKWIRVGVFSANDVTHEVKWNFFDGSKVMAKDPFEKAEPFKGSVARVTRKGKENIIDLSGKELLPEYVSRISISEDRKFAVIFDGKNYLEEKSRIFDISKRKYITDTYDSVIQSYCNGIKKNLYVVYKGLGDKAECWLFDAEKAKTISDSYSTIMWFSSVSNSFPVVRKTDSGSKFNLIREDGTLVFTKWSIKQITPDENGNASILDESGKHYLCNALTGEIKSI